MAKVKIKGFDEVRENNLRRIIMAIEAGEKEGKTHFSLTAPDPIAYINLDIGLEGVVEKFMKDKEIVKCEVDFKDATNIKQYDDQWNKVRAAWMAALTTREVRSLVVDTETELWELIRLARFGKLTQVMPHHYGPVNVEYRDLMKKAYDHDKNVILLRKLKDEYVNEKRTGKREAAGMKDIPYIVQVNLRSFYDAEDGFAIKIKNCRHNPDLVGEVIMQPMNDFATIATMIRPETETSDWE